MTGISEYFISLPYRKLKTRMFGFKIFVGLIALAVTCSIVAGLIQINYYEETFSYLLNPQCKPSCLDKGIQCRDIGETIEVQGGLVRIYNFQSWLRSLKKGTAP